MMSKRNKHHDDYIPSLIMKGPECDRLSSLAQTKDPIAVQEASFCNDEDFEEGDDEFLTGFELCEECIEKRRGAYVFIGYQNDDGDGRSVAFVGTEAEITKELSALPDIEE